MYGILSDQEIMALAKSGMIEPFVPMQVRLESNKPVISYGLSSAGYDIRLGTEFRVSLAGQIIDPKHIQEDFWSKETHTKSFILYPNSFILGQSIEEFCIPNDIMAICTGKSKLARVGIFPNITPLEPGWKGFLTIEVANLGKDPVYIYPLEGIAQILFFRMSKSPMVTYADRKGVYQSQKGIELAKL